MFSKSVTVAIRRAVADTSGKCTMNAVGQVSHYRVPVHPAVIARSQVASRRDKDAGGGYGMAAAPICQGALGDDQHGREPSGPVCERVRRLLRTVVPDREWSVFFQVSELPPLQTRLRAAPGTCKRTEAAPDRASSVNPCWRCRLRYDPRPSTETVQEVLEAVIRRDVLPSLRRRHRPASGPAAGQLATAAERLADHLLAAGPDLALTVDGIDAIVRPFGLTPCAWAPVVERAARELGDRWAQDTCDDLAITLAVMSLQTAIDTLAEPATDQPAPRPAVLVVTPPREPHRLGAVLAERCLGEAGWQTTLAAPETDAGLVELVEATSFDAVHVALSPVFSRNHEAARLTRLLTMTRAASRNPSVTISIGGRLVGDAPEAPRTLGADVGGPSAASLHLQIANAASFS
jgi:hypothetical protein